MLYRKQSKEKWKQEQKQQKCTTQSQREKNLQNYNVKLENFGIP